MKYVVTVQMTETHRVEIEADSFEQARAKVQAHVDSPPDGLSRAWSNPERIDWHVLGVGYCAGVTPASRPDYTSVQATDYGEGRELAQDIQQEYSKA